MMSKYNLFIFLYRVSRRLPNWLIKFNQGTIYVADSIKLRLRENSNYIVEVVKEHDLDALAAFSGFSVDLLKARIHAGDIGIISREIETREIKSIQWAHIGKTYIKGMNLRLNVPENSAYFYWFYSSPDIRLTGVFNTAYQKMLDLLDEKKINEYYAVVEFNNIASHKSHQRLKFKKLTSVLYLKLGFFRLTFEKDIASNKISCKINLLEVKNEDII